MNEEVKTAETIQVGNALFSYADSEFACEECGELIKVGTVIQGYRHEGYPCGKARHVRDAISDYFDLPEAWGSDESEPKASALSPWPCGQCGATSFSDPKCERDCNGGGGKCAITLELENAEKL